MASVILTPENRWEFAVRTYRMPGASSACLTLQNLYGADINMLLYCCWISSRLGAFPPKLFEQATEFSSEWTSKAVIPLRSVRTWMKDSDCATESIPTEVRKRVRHTIKTAELESEKLQLRVLESMVTSKKIPDHRQDQLVGDAITNLKLYIDHRGIKFNKEVKDLCQVVIAAAFPS